MEQKKTLWIALSACGFLLAVFGAATLLFSSRSDKDMLASSLKNSDSLYVAPPPAHTASSTNTAPVQDAFTVVGQNTPSVTSSLGIPAEGVTDTDNGYTSAAGVYQPSTTSTAQANTAFTVENGPVTTDIDTLKNGTDTPAVTPKNEKAKQDIQQTTAAKKTESTPAKKTAAGSSKASSAKTEKKSSGSSTAKAAPAPAKQGSGTTSTAAPYWVQVSSYAATKNADEARAELDKNQIPCEMFTFTKDGKLYYRVRVGPYTTKKEAEYWKQRIDSIDMFKGAGSYVTK